MTRMNLPEKNVPYDFQNHPHAFRQTCLQLKIKQRPEDFVVNEVLGFDPSDEGDHCFLYIEKKNCTTLYVRELLAKLFNIKPMHVGYSGLKDKHAVTQQLFSIKTNEEDKVINRRFILGDQSSSQSIQVLSKRRHSRKLKIGTHKANHFQIFIADIKGGSDHIDNADYQEICEQVLNEIRMYGFPNYFGNQRFGRQGSNLEKAVEMFNGERTFSKEKSSLFISAARSYLFNALLAKRVANKSWRTYVDGDRLILSGTRSFFTIEPDCREEREEVERRLASNDIAIAGIPSQTAFSPDYIAQTLSEGLLSIQLKDKPRPLSVVPTDLESQWNTDSGQLNLGLSFTLPTGSYATALIKELGNVAG